MRAVLAKAGFKPNRQQASRGASDSSINHTTLTLVPNRSRNG
jgi:hypothetical protein